MKLLVRLLCLALASTNGFLLQGTKQHSVRLELSLFDNSANESERSRCNDESFPSMMSAYLYRRQDILFWLARNAFSAAGLMALSRPTSARASQTTKENLRAVTDPNSYSALIYSNAGSNEDKKIPMLLVLHGAGNNQEGVWSLADIKGEHAGLIPSLIANNQAPSGVENFVVVAPYSAGKRSFYEEPRSRLLKFVDWVCSAEGQKAGCPSNIDPNRIFLFGFSDGATVAVELATTKRFKACVICAYGFSGILPQLALDRLKDTPFWVFHSADDVIFPVKYGGQLVKSLRSVSKPDLVRYTRFDRDQEGFTGDVRGHSVGITASKMSAVYDWLLSIP